METNSPNGNQRTEGAQGKAQRGTEGRGMEGRDDGQENRGREQGRENQSRAVGATRQGLSPSLWSGNPFANMLQLSREMDQLMDSVFGRRFGMPSNLGPGGSSGAATLWSPRIDVRQRGDSLVVSADLPGIPKDSVQIEATEEGIAISGERSEEREEGGQEQGYRFAERSYGSFYRNIPLPEGADVEQAKANMRDGVLEITIPVRQTQKRKRIQIGG